MIPQVQSRIGEHGTCFRTCLASLLNLEEKQVPDFKEANLDPGVDKFLRQYGLRYEEVPINLDDPTPLGLHLALGTSPRGGQHAVVAENGKLLHDPHPQDGTGRGLTDVKAYGLLLPLKGRAKDMSSNPHNFCRQELVRVMADVRKVFTQDEIKNACVYEGDRKNFAFHGPHGEYFHGLRDADCVSSAKAAGWAKMLENRGKATDAVPLKGKRLYTAAEKLYEKHDEIDWNLERRDWLHNKGPESTAYTATHQGIVALVNEATNLLGRAKLDDEMAYWQLKLQKAKEALKKSEQLARGGDYKQALAYQEGAFTLAHMVIDKMRNTGRAKDADLRVGVTKCQECGAKLNGDDVAEIGRKVVCPECADKAHRSKATDAAKRQRLHRALDCVMDRSFGKDLSK